jgi:hypothetical protein
MERYMQAGEKLLVCNPRMKKRGLEPSDLMDGAIVVNVPSRVKELGEDKSVISTDIWSDTNG